jgi:hypothetical protein
MWWHIMPSPMNNTHRATLADIFAVPVRANIRWTRIEAMFRAVGATVSEGAGSRVRVELNGEEAVFHRPHPENETDRGAVRSVRRFLEQAGVAPERFRGEE